MSEPHLNIFSLQQARQTLPLIRPIVDDARSCQRKIKEHLHQQFQDAENQVSDTHLQNVQPNEGNIRSARQNLKDYVNELFQIGAQLHDFDVGRVDFPSRLQDRLVYLCWETGEEDILHWHELYESCHDRRTIEEQNFLSGDTPRSNRE